MNSSQELKGMLRDAKGQANLPALVITVAVVGVMGIVGIAIFNQANRTALAPMNLSATGGSCAGTTCVTNSDQGLLNMLPMVVAAIIVIGGIASVLYLTSRGM